MKRIVFVGGLTGGHLTPIAAVRNSLEALDPGTDYYLITDQDTNNKILLDAIGAKVYRVSSGKLRRYFSIFNFVDIFKIIVGFFQSFFILFKLMPDVVFSRGSSVSVPVCIAAWVLNIPIMIHESDVSPSLTNKILKRFATRIGVSFDYTAKYFNPKKTAVVGLPIRKEVLQGNRERGFQRWNLNSSVPTVVVLGGSSGSRTINRAVVGALRQLLDRYQIILQCGEKLLEETKEMVHESQVELSGKNLRVVGFMSSEEIADVYAMADLFVSRAGGTNLVEIAMLGKTGIFIPLPQDTGRGDQRENAHLFQDQGAIVVLAQSNLTPSFLIQKIDYLLQNPQGQEMLKSMGQRALQMVYKDADIRIAQELLSLSK